MSNVYFLIGGYRIDRTPNGRWVLSADQGPIALYPSAEEAIRAVEGLV